MREARSSPLAHRSARVIGTDALDILLVSPEPSDGEEHKQDTKDDPNINAHESSAPAPFVPADTQRAKEKPRGVPGLRTSKESSILDAPILSQGTNRTKRGSPFTLKVDATARDNQSTQDNKKHNRGDYRPPIIFGVPWVGPPTVVARSTSAFKVSIYHR